MVLPLGELIAEGRTSNLYRLGNDRVIKLLGSETPVEWAQLEADFSRAVASVGLPVPLVDEVVTVGDRLGIVSEFVEGRSMLTHMIDRPGDVDALVNELVELQRTVHAAMVPDGLPSRLERMRAKIDDVVEFAAEQRELALGLVDELPAGGAVLHGDLHPGNVILGASGPVLIDWFDVAVGHPAADVERSALLLDPHDVTDLRHLPGADRALIREIHRAYCRAWEGVYEPDGGAWRAVVAAGRLAERADESSRGLLRRWETNLRVATAGRAR